MSGTTDKDTPRSKMDVNGLYREDNFTDRRVGGVQRLFPVKADGSPDESREPVFIALTHVRSERGLQPVQCQIEAKTLEEAVEKFEEAVGQALEQMRPPDSMP
jgi:hypothetical protein